MITGTPKTLSSREISYNYCVAMFTAQQLEDGLRYILDSGEHYGIIDELELTPKEKKRYKDSVELLDKATCGRLLIALKKRVNMPSEDHWKILATAIDDRNFLAHRFLVQFDYDGMTAQKEEEIVHVIYGIFVRLWKAVQIVRALKKSLDEQTDQIDLYLDTLMKECGIESKLPRKKIQR